MSKQSQEINPAGIKLSKKSATPLYVQVYEQFRAMITSGRLRPGDRLPAGRTLAKTLGVARVIVSQGYEQLVMEGYLVGKTGSGTFVAGVLPDSLLNAAKTTATTAVRAAPPPNTAYTTGHIISALPFQAGIPSLDAFPYKTWQAVGNKVLKDLKAYHLGYGDTMGHWPLRKAIAAYLRMSRAVSCEAEQVVVVTGSQQGLNLVTACLLQKGDAVWMEDPGYPGARKAFQNAGTTLCPVPVEKDGLNISYAIKKYKNARLVYTTPSYQFPLGYTLSSAKRAQLLQWAQQNNSWILEDDYDSEFRYEGNPLPCLQGLDTHGWVIYSGTFSKVLFPALRLAYIVLPSAEMAEQFRRIKNNLDRQSPLLEQLMVTKFMEEGHFLRHIRKMRLLYAQRQDILVQLLQEQLGDSMRLSVSPSGMHLLCWLSPDIDETRFRQEVKQQQLTVAFIKEYTLQHHMPPAVILGFTAFSKYKLRTGVEKLAACIRRSMPHP